MLSENNSCSKWHSIEDKYPERNLYVLIRTDFCKYPATVGYWNGYNWLDTHKMGLSNIQHWTLIEKENIPTFDENFDLNKKQIEVSKSDIHEAANNLWSASHCKGVESFAIELIEWYKKQ